jgi:hypothetical protein
MFDKFIRLLGLAKVRMSSRMRGKGGIGSSAFSTAGQRSARRGIEAWTGPDGMALRVGHGKWDSVQVETGRH